MTGPGSVVHLRPVPSDGDVNVPNRRAPTPRMAGLTAHRPQAVVCVVPAGDCARM